MLSLAPGSCCDVCAEEYGPHCQPHSIPCGHVLCANCCSTIAEKIPTRLSPACPFCRESFTPDAVRLIRTDLTVSGFATPRRAFPVQETDSAHDLWARRAERLLNVDDGCSRSREDEARRLEDRVARVAHKMSSVEEVSNLHQELQEWLTTAVKSGDQSSSLYLSAALLRAILMNHVDHSLASKHAKSTEATLKGKIDDLELANGKLEAELRRQRLQREQNVNSATTSPVEDPPAPTYDRAADSDDDPPRSSTPKPTARHHGSETTQDEPGVDVLNVQLASSCFRDINGAVNSHNTMTTYHTVTCGNSQAPTLYSVATVGSSAAVVLDGYYHKKNLARMVQNYQSMLALYGNHRTAEYTGILTLLILGLRVLFVRYRPLRSRGG